MLVRVGWHDEGLAWYGVGPGEGAPVPQYQRPINGLYIDRY